MSAILFLKERWLWAKCFLPVAFSHKPLCGRFEHDVIRLKGFYFCRSCVFLYAGVFVFGLVLWRAPWVLAEWWQPMSGILLAVAGLSFPLWNVRLNRLLRDLLRFLLGGCLAFAVALFVRGETVAAGVFGLVLLAMRIGYTPFHKRLNSSACDGCEELEREHLCSGFARKARCMKEYEDGLLQKGNF
ncbi:MAG TPA: hypothetical protein P5246_00450 [Candidatus Omnitrophota bacterium]|nr:hypothetical protein [Candidatus Omnitrophota bacterium]HSA30812.1 hypothetical protein [Candidatus Omnitrophota bacterium]